MAKEANSTVVAELVSLYFFVEHDEDTSDHWWWYVFSFPDHDYNAEELVLSC
jgi:hypothetical protein